VQARPLLFQPDDNNGRQIFMWLTLARVTAGITLVLAGAAGCGAASANQTNSPAGAHKAATAEPITPMATPMATPAPTPAARHHHRHHHHRAVVPAAPPAPPTMAPAPPPPPMNPIPQGNGGDQDGDNNGGPSDGDGSV
jgi:hypothetical protein